MSHPRPGPGDDRATRAHGAALPRSVPAPRTGSRDFPKQPALASKAYVTAEGERAEGMACADAVGGTTYNGEAQGHASGRGLFGGARLSAELLGCIFKRMSESIKDICFRIYRRGGSLARIASYSAARPRWLPRHVTCINVFYPLIWLLFFDTCTS